MNKTSQLNKLETKTVMNTKIPVFVICVELIIYLLLLICMTVSFKLTFLGFLKYEGLIALKFRTYISSPIKSLKIKNFA